MADLTSLGMDSGVKEAGSTTRVIFETGWYKMQISSLTVAPNSKGTGQRLAYTVVMEGGEYDLETYNDGLNIIHNNPVCQEIGQGQLKRMCRCVGVDFPPSDTDSMLYKSLMVYFKKETFTGNKLNSDGEYPEIPCHNLKDYKPFEAVKVVETEPDEATVVDISFPPVLDESDETNEALEADEVTNSDNEAEAWG